MCIRDRNKDSTIQVRTASGESKVEYTGENITQGSVSGALISANNLDRGINQFFETSQHEISYNKIRLQPLIFQDDIARLCTNRDDAQAGNIKINQCLETKLLDANTDKTVYLLLGSEQQTKNTTNEISKKPLSFGGIILKEKEHYKYLGDSIHREGLSASVNATIKEREGRITTSIIEVKSILEDCRLQTIGGSLAGLEIWELALIPAFLNNAETWTNIDDTSVKK